MKIPRIIFNFNDRCINQCPFCFIPFDGKGVGTPELWKRILDRMDDFSPDLLSFSGCDPLYYDDFYDVLAEKEKRCLWGVDASLMFLNKSKFANVASKLDLFSSSLDDTPEMPFPQRYSKRRLETFYDNLDFVRKFFPNLVLHTLCTPKNKDYIEKIADFIIDKKIKTWSLYQFWPFEFIENSERFVISDEEFAKIGRRVSNYCQGKTDFEFVFNKGRVNGYFFVSSIGEVYTTVDDTPAKYLRLGSIFDDDIAEKWYYNSTPEKTSQILSLKLNRETRK